MILLAIPTVKLVFRYSVINKERYILILLLYSKTVLSYMKKLKLIFLYALPALMLYVLRFMKGGDRTQIFVVSTLPTILLPSMILTICAGIRPLLTGPIRPKFPARGSYPGETLYSFSDPRKVYGKSFAEGQLVCNQNFLNPKKLPLGKISMQI